jgi:hypothetical protein
MNGYENTITKGVDANFHTIKEEGIINLNRGNETMKIIRQKEFDKWKGILGKPRRISAIT